MKAQSLTAHLPFPSPEAVIRKPSRGAICLIGLGFGAAVLLGLGSTVDAAEAEASNEEPVASEEDTANESSVTTRDMTSAVGEASEQGLDASEESPQSPTDETRDEALLALAANIALAVQPPDSPEETSATGEIADTGEASSIEAPEKGGSPPVGSNLESPWDAWEERDYVWDGLDYRDPR